MFAGISMTCFAASYAVAWALEISRLFFKRGMPRVVTLLFGAAGVIAQTMYLAHRAAVSRQSPLSNWYDWYLVAALCLGVLYLYALLWRSQSPLGLLVLTCALALVGAAAGADQTPFPKAEAARTWGWIHGVFLLAGTLTVLVGFIFGVMYLWQAWRLKHKRPPNARFKLPSLEWLERMNERTIVLSVLLLGLGFASGVVSNLVNKGLVPWTDPVVWSSGILVGWMLVAAVFQFAYKPARVGRKVAYLTVFSFLFLVLTLGIIKLAETSHGARRDAPSETSLGRLPGGRP